MSVSSVPRVRLIIVGDEILSGRRQDKHFVKMIELLGQRGMQLSGAEFVSDDRASIAAVLARSFATDDIVFSCGGIVCSPIDLARLYDAILNGRLISAAARDRLCEAMVEVQSGPVSVWAGRGINRVETPKGGFLLHQGGIPGFTCMAGGRCGSFCPRWRRSSPRIEFSSIASFSARRAMCASTSTKLSAMAR